MSAMFLPSVRRLLELVRSPGKRRPSQRRRRARTRLWLELLEDRTLPAAPTLAVIGDQSLPTNRGRLEFTNVATANPGDPVQYTVLAGNPGYLLDQTLGLHADVIPGHTVLSDGVLWGTVTLVPPQVVLYGNAYGGGEKWLRGNANAWYFLKPDGEFWQWDGTAGQLTGTHLTTLEPIFFDRPELLYNAQPQDLAYVVDQALGLRNAGYFWENWGGADERWLQGNGGQWYFLKPDGTFYQWDGGGHTATGTLLATFDPLYGSQPERLYDAQPNRFTVTFAANQLTIASAPGFVGSFQVQATATDGADQANETFTVHVTNQAPVLTVVGDQTLAGVQNHLAIAAVATGGDGAVLTDSVVAGNPGYVLQQALGLHLQDGLQTDRFHGGEQWLRGDHGDWYFLKSDGQLVRWDGTFDTLRGTPVATLEPIFYDQPQLLYAAQPQDLASVTSQALGLQTTGNLWENWGGASEHWLLGNGGQWYFLKPDGTFYRWDGTPNQASGTLLATFDPLYWSQPERLYAAQSDRFSVAFVNNQLTVDRSAGFVGSFQVRATVSDGVTQTAETFTVTSTLSANQGIGTFQVDLAPTSDTGIVGDHITSAARVSLVGQTDPNATVTLTGSSQTALASGSGAFQFPDMPLVTGDNVLQFHVTGADGGTGDFTQTITRVSATATLDPVLRWDQATLEAVRQDSTAVPVATRALAMESIAVGDAVSALDGTPTFYVSLKPPVGASAAAAVSAAAHQVLAYLYPGQQSYLDTVLSQALAEVPDGQAKSDGLTFGQAVGNAVIASRQGDGWDKFVTDPGSTDIGQWQPTAPMYAPALLPQWASLQPFAMKSSDQFQPAAPPALDSQAYADAFNEVKSLGSATGSTRTADQTQIARFWADGAGTYTPPGQWNQIAAQVAQDQGNSLSANARLFEELNLAMGDAAIVAWNAKYTYNFWRPITAIQSTDQAGNAATQTDPNWTPLLVTPNFPSYVSGHSTFSAAAASILSALYGANYSFSSTAVGLPGVTRSFTSFEQAAQEAGQSRIYGGIHYQFDNQAGLAAGHALGQYVLGLFSASADTQPPRILIDSPPSGTAQTGNTTVTGRVLDNLSGVASLQVQIDSGAFTNVMLDASGNFRVPTTFATDGAHTLNFKATDVAGNVSGVTAFTFTLDTRAPQITLTGLAAGDTIDAATHLAGSADGTGSAITRLTYQLDGGTIIPVAFDPTTGQFDQALDLSRAQKQSGPDPFLLTPVPEVTPLALHIHPHLTILIDGQVQVIPAGIGLGPDGGLPIHTHDATGTLHVESPVSRDFLLQDFFTIWGQTSAGQDILNRLNDTSRQFTMTVNGQPNTAFGSLVLHDGDDIVLRSVSTVPSGAPAAPPFDLSTQHTLTVTARDAAGNVTTTSVTLNLAMAIPFTITSFTPLDGALDVGSTFRPQVFFSRPVAAASLTADNFFATGPTGAKLPAQIVPAGDGSFAWLFFTGPMPGASLITLHVDGSTIHAATDGALLDAAMTGTPGSTFTATFTTVSLTPLIGTSLSGKVVDPGPDLQPMTFDDVRAGKDGILHTPDDVFLLPIAGVTVYLAGMEDKAVVTDAEGNFHFDAVPAGDVKLVLNGLTATNAPAGFYFPEMVMDLNLQVGQANTAMGTMGTVEEQQANRDRQEVYLPRLQSSILKAAGGATATTIPLDPKAALDLTPEQTAQYALTVAPNSLVGFDGQKLAGGLVGYSTVTPDLVREMLPQGLMQLATTLTIQAPGVAAFSTPLQITFANVYGASPGTKLDTYSFNHTTGLLEITGTATVSADGKAVTTDPDSGITHPGWFGVTPPGGAGGPDPGGPSPPPTCDLPAAPAIAGAAAMAAAPAAAGAAALAAAPAAAKSCPPDTTTKLPPVVLPLITKETASGEIGFLRDPALSFTAPVAGAGKNYTVKIEIDGPLSTFMKRTGTLALTSTSKDISLSPGSRKTATFGGIAKTYQEMFGAKGFAALDRDQLYGARILVTKTLYKNDGSKATEVQAFYVYRFVNATQADDAKNHVGDTAAFQKTLADGVGGVSSTKVLAGNLPKKFMTTFQTSTVAGDNPFQANTPGAVSLTFLLCSVFGCFLV